MQLILYLIVATVLVLASRVRAETPEQSSRGTGKSVALVMTIA